MRTRESLQELIKTKFEDHLFVVVSNREPYIHEWAGDKIKCIVPASGLVTALDPVMSACGGTWIAHGSGSADRDVVDSRDIVQVPSENPRYSLRRVWLAKEEEDGYYYGLSNEAIWPLCHVAYTRPSFNQSDWEAYKHVNEKFAQVVLQEVGGRKAFVFAQDYQLALLPRYIKEENPNIIVAQFWHIPWPNPEVMRICPWQENPAGSPGQRPVGFPDPLLLRQFLGHRKWLPRMHGRLGNKCGAPTGHEDGSPGLPHQRRF